MFSDLVDSEKKKPNTEHTKALYDGKVNIQDISVKEASEIAKFYDIPIEFLTCVCEAEHPTIDLDVLSKRIEEGKEKNGAGHFFADCLRKRLIDVYWYLGYFKGSYFYLDAIDEFCTLHGIKLIENYNKIRWSDRTMIPERV